MWICVGPPGKKAAAAAAACKKDERGHGSSLSRRCQIWLFATPRRQKMAQIWSHAAYFASFIPSPPSSRGRYTGLTARARTDGQADRRACVRPTVRRVESSTWNYAVSEWDRPRRGREEGRREKAGKRERAERAWQEVSIKR